MTQTEEAINAKEDVISTDVDVVPSSIIIGNLRRINTNQHKTIDDLESELRDEMQQKYVAIRLGAEKAATVLSLNETISDLRMAASDMLDTINECSRREAEDSRVLMQVVKTVEDWDERNIAFSMSQIIDIVKTYSPEIPVVTLETPSICTRVVSKNEEAHVISEAKMKAVRSLIECGGYWVVCINEDAVEVMEQKETITKLTALNKALRIDVADRDRYIEELNVEIKQFRDTIVELRSLVDGTGVIADKQAVTMINNQATTIEEKNTVLRAYREENNDVWSKLERIEKLVDECCMHTNWGVFVDKIKAVIQEE